MPTITFSLKDFCNLVGKKISIEELEKLLLSGKGELEGYDKANDEVTVFFGDTNLPYLWSVEGIARLVKGLIGKQKGIATIESMKYFYFIASKSSLKFNSNPQTGTFKSKFLMTVGLNSPT